MWELIICLKLAGFASCKPQPPVPYPSAYFCERAAQQATKRRDVVTVYCRAR